MKEINEFSKTMFFYVYKRRTLPNILNKARPTWWVKLSPALFIFIFLILASPCAAETGTASWYSVESCKREGTSGIMANGEVFDDTKYTCASWDYPFGTLLKVTILHRSGKMGKGINGFSNDSKSVMVLVTDRGPAKRLYRMGRIIDLSKGAFGKIAPLERGLVEVQIEEIR